MEEEAQPLKTAEKGLVGTPKNPHFSWAPGVWLKQKTHSKRKKQTQPLEKLYWSWGKMADESLDHILKWALQKNKTLKTTRNTYI